MKQYLYPGLLALAVLLMTVTLIAKCTRNKKSEKHEDVRLKIVNYDLINSEKANKYRDSLIKRNKALEIALSKKEIEYIPIRIKAQQAAKEYVKQPTIAKCDTVIQLLVIQNTKADDIIKDLKEIGIGKDTLIESYKRTVLQKDKTIGDFNTAFMDLQEDYKQALKPKRWNVSISIGYGSPVKAVLNPLTLTGEPYIGATIGRTIFRF